MDTTKSNFCDGKTFLGECIPLAHRHCGDGFARAGQYQGTARQINNFVVREMEGFTDKLKTIENMWIPGASTVIGKPVEGEKS